MLARIGTMNLGLSKYICFKRTSARVAMWASWYSNLEYKCSANKRREEHAESALTSNNNLLLEIVECQCVSVCSHLVRAISVLRYIDYHVISQLTRTISCHC